MRNLDKTYMQIAEVWSTNSYAVRNKVGAIIVKDGMIISDGYNGTPKGFTNDCETIACSVEGGICKRTGYHTNLLSVEKCNGCECATLTTKPYVLHAEANAITKIAKSTNNCEGATMYVTLSPCLECAKLIIQAGISRVVYKEAYRNKDGIMLLKEAGISVEQI